MAAGEEEEDADPSTDAAALVNILAGGPVAPKVLSATDDPSMKALSGDMIPSSVWNKYEAVFEPPLNGSLIEVSVVDRLTLHYMLAVMPALLSELLVLCNLRCGPVGAHYLTRKPASGPMLPPNRAS